MTCFEKLKELRPALFGEGVEYVAACFCPGEFGMWEPNCYSPVDVLDCKRCWEREIPVSEEDNRHKFEGWLTGESMRRLERLRDRFDKDPEDIIEGALLLYEDAMNAIDEGNQKWMSLEIVGENADSSN